MSFAFVFPGQGSQSIGMLQTLAETQPLVQQTFAEASQVLGYDLWKLCQEGPQDQLGATDRTQPAMLAAGVATWRVWRAQGGAMPSAMAGHSLGEYSALVCAEAFDFAMAIDLVRFRGEVMQAAVPKDQGAMAAILGLEDADVVAGCAEAEQGEVVEAANFNSPGQVVIAGMRTAVERASELLKAKGAKRTIMLPVSVPSHTSLMKPAAEHLAERLKSLSIAIPQVPIFTIDLGVHSSPDGIRAALCEQLVKSVRWTDTVRAISQTGVKSIVECGPGKVLTGLNRSIERRIKRDKSISMLAIDDPASLQEALLLTQGK